MKKILKYIFIGTLALNMAVQVVTFSRLCLGPGHADEDIAWARDCHGPENGCSVGAFPKSYAFGHENQDCIDVSIISVAGYGGHVRPEVLFPFQPAFLPLPAVDPAGASLPFFKQNSVFYTGFNQTDNPSVQSTILLI